jgi:hypothetical protein
LSGEVIRGNINYICFTPDLVYLPYTEHCVKMLLSSTERPDIFQLVFLLHHEVISSLFPGNDALFNPEALEDPSIVHFIGPRKPWKDSTVKYADRYFGERGTL